jgi:hypothetical protein
MLHVVVIVIIIIIIIIIIIMLPMQATASAPSYKLLPSMVGVCWGFVAGMAAPS